MPSILSAFYNGEIRPCEDESPRTGELRHTQEEMYRLHEDLWTRLDKSMQARFTAFLDAHYELSARSQEEAYIRGMRMGAQLTAALMSSNDERP